MDRLNHALELLNERVAVSREACAMADDEGVNRQSGGGLHGPDNSQEAEPQAEFRMEMRDSLPGGRAVVGVEQEGTFTWLASKEHVSEQARDEFVDLFQRIASQVSWAQNWPGSRQAQASAGL